MKKEQKIIEKYDEDTYILWEISQCIVTFFIIETSSTDSKGVDWFIKQPHSKYALDNTIETTNINDAYYVISGSARSTGEIYIHVYELYLGIDSFEWFTDLMNHLKIKILEYLPEIMNQRLIEMKLAGVV